MNETNYSLTSRREFLKTTGHFAAASALAGVALPHVHAAEKNSLDVALIGCGGRGTGAAANALATKGGPISITAMADVFDHKLETSYKGLKEKYAASVDRCVFPGQQGGPLVHIVAAKAVCARPAS